MSSKSRLVTQAVLVSLAFFCGDGERLFLKATPDSRADLVL